MGTKALKFILLVCCANMFADPMHAYQVVQQAADITSTSVPIEEPLTEAQAMTIEDYVQLGVSQNPMIAEAQFRITELQHRVPQALALPDPMVKTNTFLSPIQTAAGEQQFSLGISQKFTNSQRRRTRAAIVASEISAAQAKLSQMELEVAERIRVACFQLLFVRRSIVITQEDLESLKQISQIVRRQFEVQQNVTQQDVLNVETEIANITNQLTILRQKERSFNARLGRLTRLPLDAQLAISDRLVLKNHELSLDQLTAQASQMRPELAAQLATIQGARKKICLASMQRKPDFTVGVNWIATGSEGISPVANGDDALSLGIGFNLPIQKKRIAAAVGEAQAATMASTSRYESLQDQIIEEVFDLIAKAESNAEMIRSVQRDILPYAKRTLELSIEEYVAGELNYVQLVDNWRALLRYRITECRLISEYNQAIASLSRSVGGLDLLPESD